MQNEFKSQCYQLEKVIAEISSSLSLSRFYTAKLKSIFGLSSLIQMSLTQENLTSSAPNCRFYIIEFRRRA